VATGRRTCAPGSAAKDLHGALQELALPAGDLIGMHVVQLGKLSYGFLTPQCIQRDPGLECRGCSHRICLPQGECTAVRPLIVLSEKSEPPLIFVTPVPLASYVSSQARCRSPLCNLYWPQVPAPVLGYHRLVLCATPHRWLKPGGMWFTTVPNIDSWEARAVGSYWYGLELPRHTLHFALRSLRGVTASLRFAEVHFATPPVCYVERSFGYLWVAVLERIGLGATPRSQQKEMGVTRRTVRKAFGAAVLFPFATFASRAGAAASIEGVFAKLR
jgi:hypothetical protein